MGKSCSRTRMSLCLINRAAASICQHRGSSKIKEIPRQILRRKRRGEARWLKVFRMASKMQSTAQHRKTCRRTCPRSSRFLPQIRFPWQKSITTKWIKRWSNCLSLKSSKVHNWSRSLRPLGQWPDPSNIKAQRKIYKRLKRYVPTLVRKQLRHRGTMPDPLTWGLMTAVWIKTKTPKILRLWISNQVNRS